MREIWFFEGFFFLKFGNQALFRQEKLQTVYLILQGRK